MQLARGAHRTKGKEKGYLLLSVLAREGRMAAKEELGGLRFMMLATLTVVLLLLQGAFQSTMLLRKVQEEQSILKSLEAAAEGVSSG